MKVIATYLSMFLLLTGCAEMNSQFDCPMKPGVHCESLDQVNERVNRGQMSRPNFFKWKDSVNANYASTSDNALRHKETIMTVWIAPFQDTKGNYHEANVVYTVAKPGYWATEPLKAINQEDV